MKPDWSLLFDLSRRLLPGQGVRMQGYGDQRTLAGLQATGVNGVLTLSRSVKSGLLPSLGGEEALLALRAGPGVRLHGTADMQRIELLPTVEPEVELGPARLAWEIEKSWGAVQVCTLNYESTETPGQWVVVLETTYEGTLANYTDTLTASGVTAAYGPDDPEPDACADIVSSSTYDPGVDYGSPTGNSEVETLLNPASLVASAIAQLAVWQETSGGQTWKSSLWEDVSDETTPFTSSFGTVSMSYTVGSLVRADNLRFRLRNRGSAALRINCGFYGSGISGGATDLEEVIDLAPGATSAWQEVPSIDPDPDKYRTAEIRRVRIGRWRTLA
jgi:hypothetical protein